MDERERIDRVDRLNREADELRWLDYDRVVALAEEAYELACQTDSEGGQYRAGMAYALYMLADRNCALGNWSTALLQTKQGLALLDSEPECAVAGWLHMMSAKTRFFLAEYAESLADLMRARQIARDTGDRRLEAYTLDRIASVQSSTGDLRASIENHLRSLEIHRENGDRLGEALALNNMAFGYVYLGQLDVALHTALRALEITEEIGSLHLLLGVLDTVADVSLRIGRDDEAEKHSRRELELAESCGLEVDIADALLSLARIETAREDWSAAREHALRAQVIDERLGRIWEEGELQLLLSRIYEGSGDPASALAHYRRYHALESRMRSRDAESTLARLRVEHQLETARQTAEIARLRTIALEREAEQANLTAAKLDAQASLDALTGLFNRRHTSVLASELRHAVETGEPAALVLFDVDHFKVVNDTYGHTLGDRVLVQIASQLRSGARKDDMPCRWGGDEFLLLLVGMDVDAAARVAERIKREIAEGGLDDGGTPVKVTISAGVAGPNGDGEADLDRLIAAADRALYRAKADGRDRVSVDMGA